MGTKGVGEWADSSLNICNGCSNSCLYCYARGIANRFGRLKDKEWEVMELNHDKVNKTYRKRNGRIMMFTSHDYTEEIMEEGKIVLKKVLNAGNEVLFTTKPHPHLIKYLVDDPEIRAMQDQLLFRFTITSLDHELCKLWEPNAPSPAQRVQALYLAWNRHFQTSISIEPYLDFYPDAIIKLLIPYVTDTVWIGIMNPLYIPKEHKGISYLYQRKSLDLILPKCFERANSKLRLKDSIQNMGYKIERYPHDTRMQYLRGLTDGSECYRMDVDDDIKVSGLRV